MKSISEIYAGAERLINSIIRKEIIAQGHHLTGKMEESLGYQTLKKGKADIMRGFAAHYTRFVNEGFPAQSASYKQVPFLARYFRQRGLEEKEATAAAFATVTVWMKEQGMPTQASKRFSQTGSRTNLVENSMTGNKHRIDEYMNNGIDFLVTEQFKKPKGGKI